MQAWHGCLFRRDLLRFALWVPARIGSPGWADLRAQYSVAARCDGQADEGWGAEFLCLNVTRTPSEVEVMTCVWVCACARAPAWLPIHNSRWQRSQIPSQASERHRLSKWMREGGGGGVGGLSRCIQMPVLNCSNRAGYLVWARRLNSTPMPADYCIQPAVFVLVVAVQGGGEIFLSHLV